MKNLSRLDSRSGFSGVSKLGPTWFWLGGDATAGAQWDDGSEDDLGAWADAWAASQAADCPQGLVEGTTITHAAWLRTAAATPGHRRLVAGPSSLGSQRLVFAWIALDETDGLSAALCEAFRPMIDFSGIPTASTGPAWWTEAQPDLGPHSHQVQWVWREQWRGAANGINDPAWTARTDWALKTAASGLVQDDYSAPATDRLRAAGGVCAQANGILMDGLSYELAGGGGSAAIWLEAQIIGAILVPWSGRSKIQEFTKL